MIANWLKNALIALVFNAGAAYVFNSESPAPATDTALPAQACAVPAAPSPELTTLHIAQPEDTEAHS